MKLPVESVTVLGGGFEARAIAQVMELIQDAPVDEGIEALGQDIDDDSSIPRLVIVTDCDAPARAVEMSQVLFCQHRLWGAVLVAVRGCRMERELGNQSIVGIPGQLLYADSSSFGHGTIDIYSPNFLKLLMESIEALDAITASQFENFLKQSPMGELREFIKQFDDSILLHRHFVNEGDHRLSVEQVVSVLEKLNQTERVHWNFLVPHEKVDLARVEIKSLLESCKSLLEKDEITTGDFILIIQGIKTFLLANKLNGVSNVYYE